MDFIILCMLFNNVSSATPPPPDSTVSEDAGIEHRAVVTLALTARRSNHLARSHPLWLDLIHYLARPRSHPLYSYSTVQYTYSTCM
jgi:hypothetical protein